MASRCPICRKPVDSPSVSPGAQGPSHLPFCSERCKLIDLGRWLDGKYQIAVVEDDLDEAAESSSDVRIRPEDDSPPRTPFS